MYKNNNILKNKIKLIDVKAITSLIITGMLLISFFTVQDIMIINDEDKSSINDVQKTIISTDGIDSKLFDSSDQITIDDPTGQIDGYIISNSSGIVELNSSRGQSYRHYYNTTNHKYVYESDNLVIKPDTIDGTDWVTLEEYPITFFIRTTDNETLYASTPSEASSILSNQEHVLCVGIESFVGSAAFYINSLDSDWGHGQTVFYPRLSTGYLPDLDSPLYSWFSHLFVQAGETTYDKIINDNSLFPTENQPPIVQFDMDNDYFKIWYDLNDVTIFSQIFDFTVGIKYSFIDGKFHTINNVTCKTMNFDDIGFAYDVYCSSLDKINPTSPSIYIENDTLGFTKDLVEEWNADSYMENISSSFSLIDNVSEGFTFDYSDMKLAGFSEKFFSVENQIMPNDANYNVIRVGMEGFGQYTKGTTIEIDPTFQKLIIDEWDVSLNYFSSSYSKQTGKNKVGYTEGEFGLPDITSKFFMLWDTGLTGSVTSTSSVELRIRCYSEQLESSETVKFRLLAEYSYLRPVESDATSVVDNYWSSSAYGGVYHTPSAGTTTNLNVETLTDYWASNKVSNSIIKFRVEAGTGMDSGTNDLVQYYDGGDATSSNRPRLKFTYSMTNSYIINGDFEDNDSGLLDPDDSLIGWEFESDNGGDYYIVSEGTNKYLKIINYDTPNENGIYNQTIDFSFDEDGVIVSGDLRLKLSGTTSTQSAFIKYFFYNSNFNELGYVTFYISENESYTNTSTDLVFDLSPLEPDDPSWTSNYDTDWISYRVDLKDCFDNAASQTTLDEENERANIAYAKVITKLYTTSLNSTEAMFDNVSLSSIHLARDATRKMNIYHSDYADMIDDIEYDIYIDYGDFPSSENISRAIYDYLSTYFPSTGDLIENWIDLNIILDIDSSLYAECAQAAILTSAMGRIFGIKARIVQVTYNGTEADHHFAEFYWDSEWHMVDPKGFDNVKYFDNESTFKNALAPYTPGYTRIIIEYYLADNPRNGGSLSNSRVNWRIYSGSPYM